jgi:hypothetical protein
MILATTTRSSRRAVPAVTISLRSIMTTHQNDTTINNNNNNNNNRILPSLIVFDLDDCLWRPEMHELSGLPEIPVHGDLGNGETGVVGLKVPRYGDTVTLFEGARRVLHELATNPIYKGLPLATASSSLEPSYSYACLDGIEILPRVTMGDLMRYVCMYVCLYFVSSSSSSSSMCYSHIVCGSFFFINKFTVPIKLDERVISVPTRSPIFRKFTRKPEFPTTKCCFLM